MNSDNQGSLGEGRVVKNEDVRGGLSVNEEVFYIVSVLGFGGKGEVMHLHIPEMALNNLIIFFSRPPSVSSVASKLQVTPQPRLLYRLMKAMRQEISK